LELWEIGNAAIVIRLASAINMFFFSIATGYAMFNLGGSIETLKEYRGLNFFIGGDEGASIIPNNFKHY
jgi:hypothetical protein